MITDIPDARSANVTGALWMIAAMAGFAVEDAFVKGAAQVLPVGQILIMFGLGGAAIFAIVARLNHEPLFTPDVLAPAMRFRMVSEVVARLFFVLALATIPLSVATVILQATPLVVVAGAAMIFGERVGWRRWVAILIGMAGVLVIVQPGADSFSALSLLAVVGMLGFAGRDLASRAAPRTVGTSILGLYGFLSVVVAGTLIAVWQGDALPRPDLRSALFVAGAVMAGVCAYSCLMKAMRTGEVSAVTPFRYCRLLFGIGFGIALFGEELRPSMLLGSVLILASGLFIMWRGRQVGAKAPAVRAPRR